MRNPLTFPLYLEWGSPKARIMPPSFVVRYVWKRMSLLSSLSTLPMYLKRIRNIQICESLHVSPVACSTPRNLFQATSLCNFLPRFHVVCHMFIKTDFHIIKWFTMIEPKIRNVSLISTFFSIFSSITNKIFSFNIQFQLLSFLFMMFWVLCSK